MIYEVLVEHFTFCLLVLLGLLTFPVSLKISRFDSSTLNLPCDAAKIWKRTILCMLGMLAFWD